MQNGLSGSYANAIPFLFRYILQLQIAFITSRGKSFCTDYQKVYNPQLFHVLYEGVPFRLSDT